MFAESDHHVLALAASIRNLQHLLYSFHAGADLVTVPARILEQWSSEGDGLGRSKVQVRSDGAPIPYEDLDLEQPWERFKIELELTRKGIQRFVSDYRSTLRTFNRLPSFPPHSLR